MSQQPDETTGSAPTGAPELDELQRALERATACLEATGLERRGRGALCWEMNPDMQGGIRLQARKKAAGIEITPVAQVVWTPIEELVAIGKGTLYRPWTAMFVTRALIQMTPGGAGTPVIGNDTQDWEAALRALVSRKVIPQIVEMADERALEAQFRKDARGKLGQALRLVALQTWQRGRVDIDQAFADLMALQGEARSRARLKSFLDRLADSPQTAGVLARRRESKGRALV